MAIRISKLAREANVGMSTLMDMLYALGYKDSPANPNSKVSDEIAFQVMGLCYENIDFVRLVEICAPENVDPSLPKKIIGHIDLGKNNMPCEKSHNEAWKKKLKESAALDVSIYSEKQSFWIDELIVLSPQKTANRISVGASYDAVRSPLYSVFIGSNGVGKSRLMKEIVDFFIDLHTCINESEPKLPSANKFWLRGIRYHIDGVDCDVIRLENSYLAKINGNIHTLRNLRLPSIVACHFGAFDKFPTQTVNGTARTKYDVPYYKYVGAHVNGSMISTSAIAFRLLFALSKNMDDKQRKNIQSILDFIGYNHKISLQYTFVMKSKKNGSIRDIISQRVERDREYIKLTKQEKNGKIIQLFNFYKNKTMSGVSQHRYEIDVGQEIISQRQYDDVQLIFKLKQCDLISSVNVMFHKCENKIVSEEMSSGEFAMLSTILSLSVAANAPHTLVLLDEPELSLHPNWQMSIIDNLDRALANQTCHLLIATHSHMLVSDLPMNRSSVTHLEKDKEENLLSIPIEKYTYGWSAEEVLLKVFKTATDRNRYFGERIGKLLEQMGNNSISPKDVAEELNELQEISLHLSDVDPMKAVLNIIVETYKR